MTEKVPQGIPKEAKTAGELSDYANKVGGLLRLKRREEKWIPLEVYQKLEADNKKLKKWICDNAHFGHVSLAQVSSKKSDKELATATELVLSEEEP